MSGDPLSNRFPTTCWSLIAAARNRVTPEARQALAKLCAIYWFPLYAFFRRNGHGPDDARDLTQEYFARLLTRGNLAAADPLRGRFRTFLLADCTRFLADHRRRAGAVKRGGRAAILSIDARDAEGRFLREPAHQHTPERLFERDWGLALLDSVLAQLRQEYEQSGRRESFEVLKIYLTEGPRAIPSADIARQHGSTVNAVHVAVHRLRRRYRDLIREAIAATLEDPADVDEELRDLFAALGS